MTREEILKVARPILFNSSMVKAILEGKKTVTRRLIKPQPDARHNCFLGFVTDEIPDHKRKGQAGFGIDEYGGSVQYAKPPCKVGDILYVRETFWEGVKAYVYRADVIEDNNYNNSYVWKPSIHMPKEAARIFLKVKDVRVERLQEITEEQSLREGVPDDTDYPINEIYCPECHGEGLVGALSSNLGYMEVDCTVCNTAIKRFKHLWNSTIKKADIDTYGWDANPYVWVIEFEKIM